MSTVEPWLRATETDVPSLLRAVLHALQLAEEDVRKWAAGLSDAEINAQPHGLVSVGFHIRHLARSIDRLLTYAERRSLNDRQLALLQTELDPHATRSQLFAELSASFADASDRIRALAGTNLEESRTVGQKNLPTTLGGLLVHVADHSQRHVGQIITTTKVVIKARTP